MAGGAAKVKNLPLGEFREGFAEEGGAIGFDERGDGLPLRISEIEIGSSGGIGRKAAAVEIGQSWGFERRLSFVRQGVAIEAAGVSNEVLSFG